MTLATALVAAQSPSTLTPEQTLERRGIGDLELSPDRARLVFTVTEPVKGSARQRNIWMLDVEDGRVRQLTFSAKSDGSPLGSGRSIAFRWTAAARRALSVADGARDRRSPIARNRSARSAGASSRHRCSAGRKPTRNSSARKTGTTRAWRRRTIAWRASGTSM
jgi:hypothetical protein